MKNLIIAIALVLGFAVNAQEKKDKNAKYAVEVNGNCDMCKNRIEKAAYSVKGVKSASWDVGTHQLNVILNEQKASFEDVQTAIAKVGHDTENVKASKTEYDQLHGCCKYDREE